MAPWHTQSFQPHGLQDKEVDGHSLTACSSWQAHLTPRAGRPLTPVGQGHGKAQAWLLSALGDFEKLINLKGRTTEEGRNGRRERDRGERREGKGETEKKRDTVLSCIFWFIHQMATIALSEPGTPPRSPMWTARTQVCGPPLLPPQVHWQAAGLEAEQKGLEPALRWDTGVRRDGLSHCATQHLAPTSTMRLGKVHPHSLSLGEPPNSGSGAAGGERHFLTSLRIHNQQPHK